MRFERPQREAELSLTAARSTREGNKVDIFESGRRSRYIYVVQPLEENVSECIITIGHFWNIAWRPDRRDFVSIITCRIKFEVVN